MLVIYIHTSKTGRKSVYLVNDFVPVCLCGRRSPGVIDQDSIGLPARFRQDTRDRVTDGLQKHLECFGENNAMRIFIIFTLWPGWGEVARESLENVGCRVIMTLEAGCGLDELIMYGVSPDYY